MTEAMRMRMNWVRIDVDDRMIFKTDLLLWDEEKEDNKDGAEMMITGNTCFCSDLIKSQQNVSYLQALPVIWVDSNKMCVLAIKTGSYEKYWTEGEQIVLVTRWKGESVAAPRKKSSKAVLYLHSKLSKVPRQSRTYWSSSQC